jgi:integrase
LVPFAGFSVRLLYSPYDLRHGAASLLIAQGADLMDIKTQLGHSQIALTANTYGHLFMERKRHLDEGMGKLLGGSQAKEESG